MAAERTVRVGQRVCVRDKDLTGVVAFVGLTEFAQGKWIGVNLDSPKGKNNGAVQGKSYFQCEDNHGMFVRQTNIMLLDSSSSSVTELHPKSKDLSPRSGDPPSRIPSASKIARANTPTGIPTPTSTPRSRLPMPGKGPTGSRSPSFTDLKAKKNKPAATTQAQSRMEREPSFVEPNFVQTLKPPHQQVPTAGSTPTTNQQISSAAVMSPNTPAQQQAADRMEEKVAALQIQQELCAAKEEIRDLNEKLETLKIKRAKDQEKIKEYEKIRIQHEQLMEFKAKIMESHATLQREVQKAKHETREAVEAKEKHAEEMADLSETVELATLDKEMAEEKAETLQMELDAAKERIEELTLDLDIIKAEMGNEPGVSTGTGITNFEVKQLQAQNEKLRETLVRMRDLSAHEKNEITKYAKDVESMKNEVAELNKNNEKLVVQNEELKKTVADLQDQVDAALGSEEMVENLTTKCLDLEDKVSALIEEKEDLETLHEMNEELQENAREMELELREELELSQAKIRDVIRERDAAYEIISDHEVTIRKFRDLVGKVQEQNTELRAALEKETNRPVTTPAEMIDFKKMFAETKAHSKAIDMELRNCEVDQANRHVLYLTSYMSDSFMAKGGDNEAVLVLLLIPRLIWKANILMSQVKEKFAQPEKTDREALLKSHTVERYSFGCRMSHILQCLVLSLQQYLHALNTCVPQTFLRIGTLYPEMSIHEKSIDFYIELLRKDQLDENVPLDNIFKCLSYFENIYPLHLGEERVDHGMYLASSLKTYGAAVEVILFQLSVGKVVLASGQESSEIGVLMKTMEADANEMIKAVKTMKKRRAEGTPIAFSASVAKKMSDTNTHFMLIVRTLYHYGKATIQQAGLDRETGVPSAKLAELLYTAIDEVYEYSDGIESLKKSMTLCGDTLIEICKAYGNGEWDQEPGNVPEKPVPPIVARAQTYKAELKEAESIKYKLENKDLDIKELRKIIKAKSEELSEMMVRKEMTEKKLTDTSRDSGLMIEKLQRKLDDAHALLKRKEKEFEETLDHLQSDIESLESERGELKDKVKNMNKKALIENITKSHAMTAVAVASAQGPASLGPSVPNPVRDSPMLLEQMRDLQGAMVTLNESRYRREGEDLRRRLLKMKPLTVPKLNQRSANGEEKKDASKDDAPGLNELVKRLQNLQGQVNQALVSPLTVVNLNEKKTTAKREQISQMTVRKLREQELRRCTDQLRLDIAKFMASKQPGGEVQADFAKFPSPQMNRVINEKDYVMFGKIRLPATTPKIKTVPLLMGINDLKLIHQKIIAV